MPPRQQTGVLTRKVGVGRVRLPVWGWGLLVIGGYLLYRRAQAASGTDTSGGTGTGLLGVGDGTGAGSYGGGTGGVGGSDGTTTGATDPPDTQPAKGKRPPPTNTTYPPRAKPPPGHRTRPPVTKHKPTAKKPAKKPAKKKTTDAARPAYGLQPVSGRAGSAVTQLGRVSSIVTRVPSRRVRP